MNKIITVISIVLSTLAVGCSDNGEREFTGSGTIEATEVIISATARGKLLEINVDEGDLVTADTIIARIDTEEAELKKESALAGLDEIDWNAKIIKSEISAALETVRQAETSLENIGREQLRFANLLADNATTARQADHIDTEYALAVSRKNGAEKQIDILRTRLLSLDATRKKLDAEIRLFDHHIRDGVITAPLSGAVTGQYRERGEIVNYGTPVCTISDLSSVWLMVYVGEKDIGNLTLGGKASVAVDSHPEETFPGNVTWISPTAEFTPKNVQTRESRTDLVYAVKIELDNPDGVFKIGMPADAHIEGL